MESDSRTPTSPFEHDFPFVSNSNEFWLHLSIGKLCLEMLTSCHSYLPFIPHSRLTIFHRTHVSCPKVLIQMVDPLLFILFMTQSVYTDCQSHSLESDATSDQLFGQIERVNGFLSISSLDGCNVELVSEDLCIQSWIC